MITALEETEAGGLGDQGQPELLSRPYLKINKFKRDNTFKEIAIQEMGS